MNRRLRLRTAVICTGLVCLAAPALQAAEPSPSCGRFEAALLYSTGVFREALPQMADQCGEVWGPARGVERAWILASSCFRYSRVTNCCPLAYPIVAAVGVAWAPVGFAVGPLLPASKRSHLCEDRDPIPRQPPGDHDWGDAMPNPEPAR